MLAAELGADVPADLRRAKGFVGELLERALGATAGARDAPDFAEIGVELKTVPVDRDARPRESTFVCKVSFDAIGHESWESSRVRRKLAHVLWLPVEAEPSVPIAERRIGSAVRWVLGGEIERALRGDWEDLAGRLGAGDAPVVRAHEGALLQLRPKAAHSGIRELAPAADGGSLSALPLGFYLRPVFTERILEVFRRDGTV